MYYLMLKLNKCYVMLLAYLLGYIELFIEEEKNTLRMKLLRSILPTSGDIGSLM